ncbi:MAG: sulfatase-like hydrolase/transferase [Pseudomonadota bacterium]
MAETARNLLIIMSDEHRRDALGCMGHPLALTPYLDALAARGAVFDNGYTPSPMCVPTRASLACGDYVHRTGYWDSATPYDGQISSWMKQVRDRGINVTSIGKLHFRSAEDDNGFTEEILPMHVVNGVGWAVGLLRKDPPPYSAARELADDVGTGSSTYTDYDLSITAAAEAWLRDRRDTKTAWMAFVSLVSPHYPLTCPQEFYDLYDPAVIDTPIGYEEGLVPEHSELKNVAGFFDYDRYFDADRMRRAKAAYYGLVSFMDDCVGRILTALDDSGQADETLVIYVSDHGDMLGDHGFWTKQVMYEASVGVPMIAAGPGIRPGTRVKTATTLLDVSATALRLASVPNQDAAAPGRSLIELAEGEDEPDRTVFSEYHDGGSTTGTFMVRWDRWKYVYYVDHAPQLFDLHADPEERRDLALSEKPSLDVQKALVEGAQRLRAICDPEQVNRQCFEDQKRRIDELGGRQACRDAYVFNHTPAPVRAD